ncbi:MAG: SNF2-related protein [Flavobacteriales bacterium]
MTSDRIKQYINANSSSVIQKRSTSMIVDSYNLSEDFNSAKGVVLGSRKYNLSIRNIKSGNLTSSCSCPYSYGGICKHEVAFLNLLLKYFEKIDELKSQKEEEIKSDEIQTPREDVWYSSDVSKLVNEGINSSPFYSLPWNLRQNGGTVMLGNTQKNGFGLIVKYENKNPNVQLKAEFTSTSLNLACNCQLKNKKGYCCHIFEAQMFVFTKNPALIENHPIVQEKIKDAYAKYGLKQTRENQKKIKTNWDINSGLIITYLGKDLAYFDKKKQMFILNSFGNETRLTQTYSKEDELGILLPYAKTKKKSRVKTGYAFVLNLGEGWQSKYVNGIIVRGNMKKDGSGFSSSIFPVNHHDLENDNTIIPEYKTLGKQFLHLFHNLSNDEIDQSSFTLLDEIWGKLCEEKVYFGEEDYNGKYNRKSLEILELIPQPINIRVLVREEKGFLEVNFLLTCNEAEVLFTPDSTFYNGLFLNEFTLYKFKNLAEYQALTRFSKLNGLKISTEFKEEFINNVLQPLGKMVNVNYKMKNNAKQTLNYEKTALRVFVSQYLDQIILTPQLVIDNEFHFDLLDQTSEVFVEDTTYQRDFDKEEDFKERLFTDNQDLIPFTVGYIIAIPFDAFLEDYKFLKIVKAWNNNNIEVFGLKELKDFNYRTSYPSVNHSVSSNTDWFDVTMQVKFDEEVVPLKALKKAISKNENYVLLSDGSKGILPKEWLDKFSKILRASKITKDGLEISKLRFSAVDALFENEKPNQDILDYQTKVQALLSDFNSLKPIKVSKKIKAELRDYQQAGLNWLCFLDDFNIGGCLADDMGLGKTLQMIAFIQHLKEKKTGHKTHLVILPTSLVYNWVAEIEKFCPSLKVLVHIGTKRDKNTTQFDSYDLVITTYGLVVRDIVFLKSYEFDYIILDESQAIKNPSSQRYKAVRVLKGRNRLVLSGTPVENGLMDLYAQFSFINPGFLCTQTDFKENYIVPIEKDGIDGIKDELVQMINPFLMRRTKEQVAKDLPEKVEQVLYCSMGKKQEAIYKKHLTEIRKSIMEEVEEEGLNKSKLKVLAGLTKLRQLCNSPQLVGEPEDESVKINELVTAIKEKTGNHKILIFSQFVKMLHLIENQLKAENIVYEYLDGSTKNRQERVDHFQNDPTVRVFLISLKAGGTGLNLTASDYVYIVDPWWNPAVENQAIDRTYRIGQEKNVTAYRMICKNTIEEKILALQERKRKLTSDIISTDESFAKQITKKDLEDLFN